MRRRTKLALVGTVVTLLLSGLLLFMLTRDRRDDVVLRLLIALGKYRALTLDAESVAEMRKFARETRWEQPHVVAPVTSVRHNAPNFPKKLRRTRASTIRVRDDRVELEFGGVLLHYGIVVFRDGDGHGLKRLAEGVWFYSEDGKASIF